MAIGGIGSNAALLAAVLDLSSVQSVVQAMRAVNQAGNTNPILTLTPEPRPIIHPEPRYERRPVIHPTARYLPRPVIHPEPRVEQKLLACHCTPPAEPVVVEKVASETPVQPPWKSLPWKIPAQPAPKVKVARYHPDIIHKGTLLDFFI